MPSLNYTANTPIGSHDPADDQPQMLQNFNSIQTWTGLDHRSFSDANAGTHKQVTIATPLGSDPTLTGTFGEFYTKAVAGITQAFFSNATTVTQLTGSSLVTSGTNFGFKLPGGLIINWGQITPGGTSGTVTFAIPFTSGVSYYVVVSGRDNGGSNSPVRWNVQTLSGVNVYASNNGLPINYIAVGT